MAQQQPQNDLPVTRFQFRLSSRIPEERLLSQLMAEDLEDQSVNLSAVVKSLLLSWYQQRMQTGELAAPLVGMMNYGPVGSGPGFNGNGNGHHDYEEEREDPSDRLVQNMLGVSFDDLVFDNK